jgi:hypothetical protein
MFTQVFLFAPHHRTAGSLSLPARCTLIAVLFAALCQSLVGQMGGMRAGAGHIGTAAQFRGHGPVVPGSGGIPFRSSGQRPIVVQQFPFRHHLRFNLLFANACLTNLVFDPFFCQHFFFRNPIFFNQVVLPYPIYYPIYADQPYAADQQAYVAEQGRENELVQKIDRLRDEVESLREKQASTAKPAEPEAHRQPPPENQPTRILAFRDGHRSEIKNYALVGKTLWILTEQRAQKIPVSDLDMEATKRLNNDRGLTFP